MTILIVEDDADTRQMLATYLELEGLRVLTAANGRQALTLLDRDDPHVLLVDLMMPVMDGVEFRRHQRRHPRAARLPFVVFTAAANGAAIAESLEADGFLAKPVDLASVLAMIDRVTTAP